MEALITLATFREANKSPFNTFDAFNYIFSSCPPLNLQKIAKISMRIFTDC